MSTNRIRKYTIISSLLLHFLLAALYTPLRSIHLFRSPKEDVLASADKEKQIVFELVETPDDARSKTPPENATLLSDKNSRARDLYASKDKETGTPFSRGDLDVKELPHQQNQAKQNIAQENQPMEQLSQEEERDPSGSTYDPPKFSREALMGKNAKSSQLNRVKYDNDDFNAEEIGGMSFNTYEWNFAPYMFEMKRKVERNIFPPPAFTRMGMIDGETILKFKVLPSGDVKDLEVLKYIGHKSLMETSVQALRNSSPFRNLPADFPENYLEVTARFTYYIKR